jgi:hypothetical protein
VLSVLVWVLSVDGGALQRRIDVGLEPYIERVFDNDLVELDAAGTFAAHWADLHPGEAIAAAGAADPTRRRSACPLRGAVHAVRLGGEGTPTVAAAVMSEPS